MIKYIVISIILLTSFALAQQMHLKGTTKVDTLLYGYSLADSAIMATKTDLLDKADVEDTQNALDLKASDAEFQSRMNTAESEIIVHRDSINSFYSQIVALGVRIDALQPDYPLPPTSFTLTPISTSAANAVWNRAFLNYDAAIFDTSADGITWTEKIRQVGSDSTYSLTGLAPNTLVYGRVSFFDSTTNQRSYISPTDTATTFSTATTPSESAGNVFVDNTATGLNNGTSWENAYTSFASISWATVGTTDTIFISGGTVSKTYNMQMLIGKSGQDSTNRIVIRPGYSTGHSGEVIIDCQNTRSYGIRSSAYSYISIENLTILNTAYDGVGSMSAINCGSTTSNISHIDIIGCTIHHPESIGIKFVRVNHGKILNNTIYTGVTIGSYDTDGIYLDGYNATTTGNIIIDGNTIINEDNNTNTAFHHDNIQITGYFGYIGKVIIRNNFLAHFPTAFNYHHTGIMVSKGQYYYEIYNNVFVNADSGVGSGCYGTQFTDNGFTAIHYYIKFYNNTSIMKQRSDHSNFYFSSGIDSLLFKNNIGYGGSYAFNLYEAGIYKSINYNQYYNMYYSSTPFRYLSVNYTLTNWRAIAGDTDENGHISALTFDNIWGTTAVGYKIATGVDVIDKGITLTLFNTDYAGTSRPVGDGWDKGAYEE